MIPSIITIISGNLSQNSGGYNSDIIGIRDIICFSNKSGILPGTYFVTSHHMFSIISGILGIFSHSDNVDKSHRMVPPVLPVPSIPSSGLLLALASAALHHVPPLRNPLPDDRLGPGEGAAHAFVRRDIHDPDQRAVFVIYSCLIPILVLLSGLFAGLTLGYMSLDETQLNVLSVSGTP